jgi:hypothetical protein
LINVIQWPTNEGGNDHWYAVLPRVLLWQEADSAARILKHENLTGYPATVISDAENDFISSNVVANLIPPSYIDQYWLGAGRMTHLWKWVTGEPFIYWNWAPDEPNNLPTESTLTILGYSTETPGLWNNSMPDTTRFCANYYWAIIEWGEPLTDTIINVVQWRLHDGGNDHWYGILPHLLLWPEADSMVRTIKHDGDTGYLATITSGLENDFITNQVINGLISPGRWDAYLLGGIYSEGDWLWITGEPFDYTNWSQGEPNNLPIETRLTIRGPGYYANVGRWNNVAPDTSLYIWNFYWSVIEWVYYRCGDVNGDDDINMLDILFLINYLYKGGVAPDPPAAGNVNMHGLVDMLDAIYLVAYLYRGGPEPICP